MPSLASRLVSFATLLVVVVGLASGCGARTDVSSTSATGSDDTVDEVLGREFAVFRGVRQPSDVMPDGLVPKVVADRLQINLATSRRARTMDGKVLFLVASSRLTCLFSEIEPVGGCWPTPTVAKGLATTTALCGPGQDRDQVVTFGIVPDGVRWVQIVRTNVPSAWVRVRGNVFVGETSSKPPLPLHISWVANGQQLVHPTGIPPKVARVGCRKHLNGHSGAPALRRQRRDDRRVPRSPTGG